MLSALSGNLKTVIEIVPGEGERFDKWTINEHINFMTSAASIKDQIQHSSRRAPDMPRVQVEKVQLSLGGKSLDLYLEFDQVKATTLEILKNRKPNGQCETIKAIVRQTSVFAFYVVEDHTSSPA
jgi:hypothetical protein